MGVLGKARRHGGRLIKEGDLDLERIDERSKRGDLPQEDPAAWALRVGRAHAILFAAVAPDPYPLEQ